MPFLLLHLPRDASVPISIALRILPDLIAHANYL
jgi:hypothetical protein